MKERSLKSSQRIAVVSFVLSTVVLTSGCASDHRAKGSSAPDEAEMTARWMAFMTPGAEHKVLDSKVGKWSTHVSWWMDESSPPGESDGTCEIQWVLGGRYLSEHDEGTAMGMPFQGMGISGYDNLKKKYVTGWVDNMGTGIMTAEGTYDAAKKTFTYMGSGPDLVQEKYVRVRTVETMVDANHFKVEMYGPDPKGKEFRTMEIVYTRVK
jgi:hypothetical protein